MEDSVEQQHYQTFEYIKQIDKNGNKFWYARALSKLLGYADFRNFIKVAKKAKEAYLNSGFDINDHIVELSEEITHGKGAKATYPSFALSRYAYYLIVENAPEDLPTPKENVAKIEKSMKNLENKKS